VGVEQVDMPIPMLGIPSSCRCLLPSRYLPRRCRLDSDHCQCRGRPMVLRTAAVRVLRGRARARANSDLLLIKWLVANCNRNYLELQLQQRTIIVGSWIVLDQTTKCSFSAIPTQLGTVHVPGYRPKRTFFVCVGTTPTQSPLNLHALLFCFGSWVRFIYRVLINKNALGAGADIPRDSIVGRHTFNLLYDLLISSWVRFTQHHQ
jgi:hypothetical protein